MSTDLIEIAELRSRFAARFGRNKTEELCRLLYEVGRRETKPAEWILSETLITSHLTFEEIGFSKLKSILLKRRFPNLSPDDLARTYLTPLRLDPNVSSRGLTARVQFEPTQIFIEKKAAHYLLAERVQKTWPNVATHFIDSIKDLRKPKSEWLRDFGKRTLAVSVEEFDLVKPCPCSSSTVSCNYYLLNIGYGCPFDCSYCYLQEYQNLPAIVLPANLEFFLSKLDEMLKSSSSFTRIGTGEYADSLALDWLTEYSKTLVPFFADKPVTLELKTKSDCVENLIGLKHGGKTVIAWSVNPARFAAEEKGTAPIEKRLAAASKCEQAGYGTAFHFDPILITNDSEKDYRELVDQIYTHVKNSIRWFSLGTLRFHRDLRQVAEVRHPESEIFLGEERLDPVDGKMRYSAEARIDAYKKLVSWIRQHDPNVPIYLCMESAAVWRSVFEGKPYEGRIDEWIACSSE